ncbi:EamA family transporter RarD [Desulfococcus sp.]|uniref:EamA family transporter RarD n=1 Tax=Desulfococcus sp. TaxID=2025834 RepID=UPI003593EC24
MGIDEDQNRRRGVRIGIASGASAFLIWGLSPAYWKMLAGVPALEIITHRMVWSFVFLLPLILISGRRGEFTSVLTNRKTMGVLLTTSLLVSVNWLIYIWAVNTGHVLQASLGYYINPLVNVLLGMVFLKERLRRPQALAVLTALAGVVCLGVSYGQFPWISISLAVSFGCYGLVRKVAAVGALVGLAVETLLLSVPALFYLVHVGLEGRGAFLSRGPGMDLILMGSALVTAVPLLLFTTGTRRLSLSTVGFLQYIAPTGMFLLGVFAYGEPFSTAQIVTFSLIWTALAVYSVDAATHCR